MTVAAHGSPLSASGIEYTKKYVKQMLKGMLFVGTFKEKRFVEDLRAYRDVVTVCPNEEKFIENLKIVKRKINRDVLYKNWLGITEPDTIGAPVGHNLWVLLSEEVFGKYWYRVKTIEFLDHEIRLKLEILRPFQKESTALENSSDGIDNLSAILQEKKLQAKENLVYFFKNILTLHNVKESLIFVCLLISAIFLAAFNVIQYLLEYFLKFLREVSGVIKASTPILITFTNLVGRTIFAFFQLVYALCKGKTKPAPVYNNYINFDPHNPQFIDPRSRYNKFFNKAIPYYPDERRGPTITPIS